MSKISDSKLLAMVLGGKTSARVFVQPGGGAMVNMNVVENNEVTLVGISAPLKDFDVAPKSGIVYDVDAAGELTICKDTVKTTLPSNTSGCSMRQLNKMQSQQKF